MTGKSKEKTGLIQVYTGTGKGKTTGSLGLSFRALGHGWNVKMICFMKGDPGYGEAKMAKKIENFELIQSGLPTFVKKGEPSDEDLRLAAQGWKMAEQFAQDESVDLLILDEINVAVDYGLLPLDDVLRLIDTKRPSLELVLTGRYVPDEIVKRADLVSDIQEVKHPYLQGIPARQGIDY